MQAYYFDTGTNNACSYAQKMEIIHLICFLTQIMNKKDPEKYPGCLEVLGSIFNVDFNKVDEIQHCGDISSDHIRSFGLICNNLMWGTMDEITKPEGINNAGEIRDKIINYFTNEWSPF